MKIKKNFLVISNYNNELNWIPTVTDNYIIYDQSETPHYPTNIDVRKVIRNRHTGHNISDHLTFIIDNYDALPECTIFAKGNIFPRHITETNFKKIMNNTRFTPIEDLETNKVDMPVCFFENGGFNEINNDWYVPTITNRIPHRYAKSFNDFLSLVFQKPTYPKYVRFAPGANYIVPRDYIKKYPKVFYENLRNMVSYGHLPIEAYFTERALYTIWTSNDTINKNMVKNPMKTLDDIAINLGTDKSSLNHNYTKHYANYFDPIRHDKLKIFEIGIDKGFSLLSWKEYFDKSEITGIDIIDLKHLEEDRIHILQGDQKDQNILEKAHKKFGPFDIIIDDGSHHNKDMLASFEFLFPLLKPGGIYVVEDLHACYWGKSHGTGKPVFIDKIKLLVDYVNSSGKSGVANILRDEEDGWYNQKKLPEMNWWEKNVEFVHVYRSIVFIKKYPKESIKSVVSRKSRIIKEKLNPKTAVGKVKDLISKHK